MPELPELTSSKSIQPNTEVPKPGWLVDKGLKLGFSRKEMHRMSYNEFLEKLGLVIEGKFRVLPPDKLPSPEK
ncbi:MAG: hypothetical protein A2784_02205 [Candidatus Chisholmbacteria bacterium RIFCSPHIGHO2_01_FULL_48_12]|uniref:Uncharacterized protein n=1 Tax=Candidatus Chisholmbacteria bacterium RIFCSPHIGHO2_01_FULL_48_12 TaxID=1797589 RepID=A0A1G1VLN9_9BACT|nr:MAG: hypothetical protein A2784_02205 [Candidatus Chisholmbacteria bacterium RIFCSPHIGHO2_01_FULL_48_12]